MTYTEMRSKVTELKQMLDDIETEILKAIARDNYVNHNHILLEIDILKLQFNDILDQIIAIEDQIETKLDNSSFAREALIDVLRELNTDLNDASSRAEQILRNETHNDLYGELMKLYVAAGGFPKMQNGTIEFHRMSLQRG